MLEENALSPDSLVLFRMQWIAQLISVEETLLLYCMIPGDLIESGGFTS